MPRSPTFNPAAKPASLSVQAAGRGSGVPPAALPPVSTLGKRCVLATRQGDGASSPDAAATRRAAATRVQPRAKQGPLVSCRRCVQGAGHRRAGAGSVSRDTHCGQSATRTVASGTCRMELQVHDGATRGGHAQACCCSGGRHPAVPSTRGPKEGRAGPTVSFMASPWALPFMPSTLSRWSRERPLHEGEEGAGVTSRRCRGRQGGSRRGG